jgi:hypothetical protein
MFDDLQVLFLMAFMVAALGPVLSFGMTGLSVASLGAAIIFTLTSGGLKKNHGYFGV